MYRGRRAVISWTMTTMLTVASALGVVAVSHAVQTPLTSASAATTAASTATTHPVVYTTYRGDDGSSNSSSSSIAAHFD